MNKILKSIMGVSAVAVCLGSFTSCMDETEPTTVATEEQIAASTSASEALLMAMPAYFNKYTNNGWHHGFGYPSMMYIRDLMTGDLCQTDNTSGYHSHFYYWARNKYQGDGYIFGQYIYNYFYEFVLTTNNMIGGVNEQTATAKQLGYLGAGLAFRAMVYLDMARCFEFLPHEHNLDGKNIDGNIVTNLTVPIVKAGMTQEEARNNPRATRTEMFDFILEDLNKAEEYIVNLESTSGGVLPDLACVYGLKARLYMWVEDYANAAIYARKAIDQAGTDPMTQEECINTKTGFNDISQWMWGTKMTSEDDVVKTGIINWASWLSNQTSFGYTGPSTSLYNMIDKNMYERIADTDFRKLLWIAPAGSALEGQTPLIEGSAELPEYVAVKFRPNEGNIETHETGAATCVPVMRVEEMYFIEAEAVAHANADNGKALLEQFMKTYRDASYACTNSDIIDEIVFQKRVELWGEGHTFFDIKRLDMSVTRGYPGTNWYDLTRLNTNGRPAWMNFVIVRTEANNNQGLVGMNNPDPSDLYTPWTE